MIASLKPTDIAEVVHRLLSDPRRYQPTVPDIIRISAQNALAAWQLPVYVANRPLASSNLAITIRHQGGNHAEATHISSGYAESVMQVAVWGEDDGGRETIQRGGEIAGLIKIMLIGMRRDIDGTTIGDCQPVFLPTLQDVQPEDASDNWAYMWDARYRFNHTEIAATLQGV